MKYYTQILACNKYSPLFVLILVDHMTRIIHMKLVTFRTKCPLKELMYYMRVH